MSTAPALLTDRVVLVTGAGSGIGRAIVLACAAAGARVAVTDVDAARAAETCALATPDRTRPWELDVTSAERTRHVLDEVVAAWGRLDGAVANAGVFGGRYAALELPDDRWEAALRVNLTGTFHTLREAARRMVERGDAGSLVAIGSSQGVRAIGNNLGYSVAKAGVHHLVRALAVELAPHRIRVNGVVPGVTETPATTATPGYLEQVSKRLPLGAPAQPAEIAELVALLLSDRLPHATGALMTVDSGVTIA
jgi:NAD(P)-dependent dehydrogenase (short-subunit alcohol dehydrogenase family)